MTYPYSNSISHNHNDAMLYDLNKNYYKKNDNNKSSMIGGAIVGGSIGATTGFLKNPYFCKNHLSNNFAREVYENYLKLSDKNLKETYIESNKIINSLSKIKNKEELQNLLNENPLGAKEIFNSINESQKSFLNNVNNENLINNKEIIKEKLEATNNLKIRNIKNKIYDCWNKDAKRFENKNKVSNKIFEAIEISKRNIKIKQILIFTGIAAVIGSILGYIINRFNSFNK